MVEDHLGLIELSLVFGIVLALALYELWSVRRAIAEDKKSRRDADRDGNGPEA